MPEKTQDIKLPAGLSLLPLRARPELLDQAAAWFHKIWGIPLAAYQASMQDSLKIPLAVPQWYLALDQADQLVAGAGLIANDFHQAPELTPNVCAVYVEPAWRGQGLARAVLDFIRRDSLGLGVDKLYLLTDHTEFYEKCGWHYQGQVQENSGGTSRVYQLECNIKKEGEEE